jgi:N-acetylglucosamine-6-phosphate deacetylase
VKIALGHTAASMEEIDNAVAAGAELVTHLGNGVPTMLPRHDNIIQRLLAPEKLIICVIPDGIHLPPFVLKNFCCSKNQDKVFFATDCMAAAGAPIGRYRLLNLDLEVGNDGIVRMPGGEGFAGSSLTMDRAVVNISEWLGISAADARDRCAKLPREFFNL